MTKESDNSILMILKWTALEVNIGDVKAKVHISFFMKKSKKHQ